MSAGDALGAVAKALGVGGAGTAAALNPTAAVVLGALLALAGLLLVVLVVAPAVWSRKPARRRAALAVLQELRRGGRTS